MRQAVIRPLRRTIYGVAACYQFMSRHDRPQPSRRHIQPNLSPAHFILPGDALTRTGGYRYDRRIVLGLRETGWRIELVSLDAGFPQPGAAAMAHAQAAIAALPDDALVIADGLAFGAMPEIAECHADRLRWVALVHHPLWLETGLDEAMQRRLKASEQRALAAARRVIVTSPTTAAPVVAMGVSAERIRVVEPGTDAVSHSTRPAAQADSAQRGLNLLCVATITPRKGHRVLIDALAGLCDRAWTLHCFGSLAMDPDTTAALRATIAQNGLSARVLLHGEADDAALDAAYAQADVFVLASLYEGYGMVLADALARGLPVVSTTAGAIPHTVPQTAGLLVAPGDAAALRSALADVIDDPACRERLAAGARATQGRWPTWPAACARFAQALQSV